MRTITDSVNTYTSTAGTQAQSASVPISVFRDLAAELQVTHATINALTTQNQQLAQENQFLRQEITKVVQSTLHLQNLVDSFASTRYNQIPYPSPHIINETYSSVTEAAPFHSSPDPSASFVPPSPVLEISNSIPESIFIEEEEVEYYTSTEAEAATVSTWWLILAVLLIILMGFGTGYLIVRPFFQHHNH
ncbi:MAG: hypothetical protein PUP92_34450 [Rhizonema sp. PD38]|nr:hypothetical protein [Rhizonema sp. PD38]